MLMKTKLKKEYEKPGMQVFALKQTPNLLTLSNPGNYENGGDPMSSPELSPLLENEGILFE